MATTFTKLLFHIVFSTKGRALSIRDEVRERLYEYIGGIVRGEGGALLVIGGMPDHVHLLAGFRADASVAVMVRKIKANSSRWMNDHFGGADRFEWQAGYAAFSVSESRVAGVRRYIETQADHHARVSFRDELVALLERHGIEYDERYLLG